MNHRPMEVGINQICGIHGHKYRPLIDDARGDIDKKQDNPKARIALQMKSPYFHRQICKITRQIQLTHIVTLEPYPPNS
jgi:hypothetical protein